MSRGVGCGEWGGREDEREGGGGQVFWYCLEQHGKDLVPSWRLLSPCWGSLVRHGCVVPLTSVRQLEDTEGAKRHNKVCGMLLARMIESSGIAGREPAAP